MIRARLPADAAGRWRLGLLALSSLLSVAFIAVLPIGLLAGAGHDDAWFWWRAESIAGGHWMGDYDQMTLAKGSGYPMFLALVHASGLSVALAQGLAYCAACLALGAGVRRLSGRPWLAFALVLAIQWHPSAFAWTRLQRDQLGGTHAIALLACLLLFIAAPRAGARGWRWAALAGLVMGWIWTTREDAVWLAPGLAVLLLPWGVAACRDRAEARRLGVGLAIAAATCIGWSTLVATANQVKYGVAASVETRGWAYADALSALQRVRVGAPTPFVPVPARVRAAVYAESPAFARLQPQLEGPMGDAWKGQGCAMLPESCGDIAGGWFMWAFRDAVAAAGGHASGAEATRFYGAIATDIEAACDTGRLDCVGLPRSLLPPVTGAQWRTLPARSLAMAKLLTWQRIGDGQTSSHGDPQALRAMWEFANRPPLPDTADALAAVGMPAAAASPQWLRWAKWYIGIGYGWVLPWLWAAGVLAFGWACVAALRARRLDPLLVLAATAWCLVAGRAGLMVLVDMAAFPAIKVHYMQPAYALLVVAALASIAVLRRPAQPATGPG